MLLEALLDGLPCAAVERLDGQPLVGVLPELDLAGLWIDVDAAVKVAEDAVEELARALGPR